MPGGKPKDPDYWKKWRAAHPEYRAKERERLAARERPTEERQAERAKAKAKAEARERQRKLSRETSRRYREAHPEKILEKNRRYYADHLADQRAKKNQRLKDERAAALLADAAAVASKFVRRDWRTDLLDPLWEDARSTALIAMCEVHPKTQGPYKIRRAEKAVAAFLKTERRWRWSAQPLTENHQPRGVEVYALDQDPVAQRRRLHDGLRPSDAQHR